MYLLVLLDAESNKKLAYLLLMLLEFENSFNFQHLCIAYPYLCKYNRWSSMWKKYNLFFCCFVFLVEWHVGNKARSCLG